MKQEKILNLLKDLELLIRINAPLTDGSTIHRAVKAAIKQMEGKK